MAGHGITRLYRASTRERVPEAGAEVVEVGRTRIAGVDEVDATDGVEFEVHRGRERSAAEAEPDAALGVVGPILTFDIHGDAGEAGDLGAERRRPEGVADTFLIVEQGV